MSDMKSTLLDCRKMLDDGADIDAVLQVLRDRGFSKVHSIKALVDLGEMQLGEAKNVVHESKVWSDVYDRDTAFQDQLGDALND